METSIYGVSLKSRLKRIPAAIEAFLAAQEDSLRPFVKRVEVDLASDGYISALTLTFSEERVLKLTAVASPGFWTLEEICPRDYELLEECYRGVSCYECDWARKGSSEVFRLRFHYEHEGIEEGKSAALQEGLRAYLAPITDPLSAVVSAASLYGLLEETSGAYYRYYYSRRK